MSPRSPHIPIGLGVAAIALLLDQLTKWIVINPLSLQTNRIIDLVPIFQLSWAENCGISLSLFAKCTEPQRWMLVGVTGLVAAGVLVWMTRERARGDVIALALVLGGAIGNIVDRIRFGYVVDFADLHFGEFRPFLIFNVADACITIGVLILVARALLIGDKGASEMASAQADDGSKTNDAQ